MDIAEMLMTRINQDLDIDFYESAIIHMILVKRLKKSFSECKLINDIPSNTSNFMHLL